MSQSKIPGPGKFTLRYQQFEIKGAKMNSKMRNMYKLLFCDMRGHVEISVFEISKVDKKHEFCAVFLS